MKVVNRHTATVENIAPGAEGSVDETVLGVQGFLRAGYLVEVKPAEAPKPDAKKADADKAKG